MLLVLGADQCQCLMAMMLKNHIGVKEERLMWTVRKKAKQGSKSQPSNRREVEVMVFSIVDGCRHVTLK